MTELQSDLKDTVRKFCLRNIEPFMEEDDRKSKFRMEIFEGLGELGLCGMVIPEKYGGAGLTYEDLIIVLEEIARYSVAYAVTLSVSTMTQAIINEYGSEDQKQKYLPELASGKSIGAFSLSEANSGSDAASLKTSAKKNGNDYIINGTKLWTTSGGIAKTYIVMARTGENGPKGISSFIIEDTQKGFSVGKNESKMGWKVSPTRELIFENAKVSSNQLLSKEGEGFKIAMSALDRGRITIGALANGLSERSLEEAIKYSLIRKQFNQPIFDFQGISFLLSEMATEIECSKLLVQKAAKQFDQNIKDVKIASMAKLKSTDTAMYVTTNSLQVLGGIGYTTEYPLERFMRDAKVLQIVEGTNQIQKVVIAKNLKNFFKSN